MVHRERLSPTSPCCWLCGSSVAPDRIDREAVLCVRSEAEGGPYRRWDCSCGAECGALQNAVGSWILHPLEGLDDPDLIERLIPRQSRATQDAALEWWKRNAAPVERFRRGEPMGRERPVPAAEPEPPRRPPPRPRPNPHSAPNTSGARRSPPRTPRKTRRLEVEQRSPHELLSIEAGATQSEIRSAYRAALKLCHPDRVANLDPEIQDLAHRKAKALRRAYESLLKPR